MESKGHRASSATSLVQSPLRVLEKSSLQLLPLASCFYREDPKAAWSPPDGITRQLVVLLFSSYAHLITDPMLVESFYGL